MKPGWYRLALVIWQLNRIPRYGRYYRWTGEQVDFERKPSWRWTWDGRWGHAALQKIGMYWDFLDESTIRYLEEPGARQRRLRERRERRLTIALVVMAVVSVGCLIFGTLAS
jgi:hypothetical protein